MIIPKFITVQAGTTVDLKDCAYIRSLSIIGIFNDGSKENDYFNFNTLLEFLDIKNKELYLPKQFSHIMPCKYVVKYEADRPDGIKITCDKKFPTYLKFRAVCTFDISDDDSIVLESIDKINYIEE